MSEIVRIEHANAARDANAAASASVAGRDVTNCTGTQP